MYTNCVTPEWLWFTRWCFWAGINRRKRRISALNHAPKDLHCISAGSPGTWGEEKVRACVHVCVRACVCVLLSSLPSEVLLLTHLELARWIAQTNNKRDALIGQKLAGCGLKSNVSHTEAGSGNSHQTFSQGISLIADAFLWHFYKLHSNDSS